MFIFGTNKLVQNMKTRGVGKQASFVGMLLQRKLCLSLNMFLIDLHDVHLTSKVAYTHLSKKLNKLKWVVEKIKMLCNICCCKISYIS